MAKQYLHIGVFRGGRLVDERHAPEKGTLTIGKSAGNTIWLAGSTLPDQHTLFTFDHRHPMLHVVAGMKGELALDGKVKQPLDALKAKGQATSEGWNLELPDTARGWVALGDTSFFLQVSPKPPPPPKTTLPASAQTGMLSGFEKTFATVFAVVFAVELAGFLFIASRPDMSPDAPLEQEDLDRFAEIIMPEKKPEVAKTDDKKADDTKTDEKKEEKKEEKKASNEDEASKKAAHAAAVSKAVASSKLLQVLGSTGGDGALANVFGAKGFGADIASALDGAGGVKIANGDEGPEHKGGSGGDGTVGIGDLNGAAGGGGGKAHLGERKSVQPQISVDDGDVDVEGGNIDKDALGKFVRNRLRAIQGCYEQELKLNPTLKGKIVVRFTVTSAGRVGETSIDNDTMHNDKVSSCIMQRIKAWIFPFKPDEDVPVSFPFVFQPGG